MTIDHLWRLTNVVATLSGNSFAIIAKLAVKKPAFPIASTIRIAKLNPMNVFVSSTLSRNLKQSVIIRMTDVEDYELWTYDEDLLHEWRSSDRIGSIRLFSLVEHVLIIDSQSVVVDWQNAKSYTTRRPHKGRKSNRHWAGCERSALKHSHWNERRGTNRFAKLTPMLQYFVSYRYFAAG